MIYIYNDYGGTHTTALAAAYHLKQLPQTERKLMENEILKVPYFNKLTHADFGKLIYHGIDEDENPVYTLGRKSIETRCPCIKGVNFITAKQTSI